MAFDGTLQVPEPSALSLLGLPEWAAWPVPHAAPCGHRRAAGGLTAPAACAPNRTHPAMTGDVLCIKR